MSHTLQTAIAFPVVLASISVLIATGPILYGQTLECSLFARDAILASVENHTVLSPVTISLGGREVPVMCASPEKMDDMVRAIRDSAVIIYEGVMP